MTEIELAPCPFCEGPVHRKPNGDGVDACYHIGMPHCPVGRWTMTVEQWNFRRPEAADKLEALSGRISNLEAIEATARELVTSGLRTVAYADTPKLCVIEKADKSDPHYRLCTLLDALAQTQSEG